MGNWVNEDTMEYQAFVACMEAMIELAESMVNAAPLVEFPALTAAVSKIPNYDEPCISVFPMPPFSREQRYGVFRFMGSMIAKNKILVSAIFTATESWHVAISDMSKLPEKGQDLSAMPGRTEIIAICGKDITGKVLLANLHIERDKDNNRILISRIDRTYLEDHAQQQTHSDMLSTIFEGYANELHIQQFGVAIDKNDPTKFVRPKGNPVKSDS